MESEQPLESHDVDLYNTGNYLIKTSVILLQGDVTNHESFDTYYESSMIYHELQLASLNSTNFVHTVSSKL